MRRLTLLLCVALLSAPACPPDGAGPGDNTAIPDLNAPTLEQLMQVQMVAAALHPQTLQDAPASATVITGEDIRKYGYRTHGEAPASVRGFYLTNNRTCETIMDTASVDSAKALFSGPVFKTSGQSPLFFPQFKTPQDKYGEAINLSAERGYHFFSTVTWRIRTVAESAPQWRIYYDSFHNQGRGEYVINDGAVEDNRANYSGRWAGTQLNQR